MNSRRTFIKQAGVLGAGIILMPSIACNVPKRNIGIQLYTLRDVIGKDPKGVIARVAEAGYTEVEVFDYNLKSGFCGLKPSEFLTLLKDNGLTAPSGHYGIDELLKENKLDAVKRFIEAANAINSSFLTIPWMDEVYRKTADDYKRNAERFNRVGELCKSAGLQLAYHNHNFEFEKFGDTTGLEILMKETDPELLKFEMDIYWVVRAGSDPLALIDKHPGRFELWHVKDMSKTNQDENTEVGNGSIDFKSIFKKRNASGLQHFFVEQETNYQPNEMESIKTSAAYIGKTLI